MHAHHSHTATRPHRRFHTAALGMVFLLLGVVVTEARERPPVQSVPPANGITLSTVSEPSQQK